MTKKSPFSEYKNKINYP